MCVVCTCGMYMVCIFCVCFVCACMYDVCVGGGGIVCVTSTVYIVA